MTECIAVDLGASNGRTILGRFDGARLKLEELNRFENNYVRIGDSYYWDILRLYTDIKQGIGAYARKGCGTLGGIGIDTWGVDFGLIDTKGRLVGNPFAYRDPRAERGMKAFFAKFGDRTLFDLTGIANMPFNTVFRLYDMAQQSDPQLTGASKLLLLPDLLGYMLSGEMAAEYTNATTTQMLGRDGRWSRRVLDMVGISESLMPPIQMSGTLRGRLLKHIQEEAGLNNVPPVFAVGSHDTASAVASIPSSNDNYAFISSGTWSLVGIVVDQAITGDAVFSQNFSNEGTVDGRYRLLRNIMGLWIIQNCRHEWEREAHISWDDIVGMASQAPAFSSFIDVNAPMFYSADNMVKKIRQYCERTGQQVPNTKGEIARTVYESLAMSYREVFEGLEALKGKRIDVIHIVGGGSKNRLLNQLTADAVGREVVAGPAEATAIGNLMLQVKASAALKDWAQLRQVIRDSFDVESFEPDGTEAWREQYNKFLKIKERYKDSKGRD